MIWSSSQKQRMVVKLSYFVGEKKPDVILMDLMMPEMDGIAATRAILAEHPGIKIIAMTSFEEEQLVQGVLAAGAISYLIKNVTSDELAKAIRDGPGHQHYPPKPPGCLFKRPRPQRSSLCLT